MWIIPRLRLDDRRVGRFEVIEFRFIYRWYSLTKNLSHWQIFGTENVVDEIILVNDATWWRAFKDVTRSCVNRIHIWRDERSSDLIGSGGAGRSDWLRACSTYFVFTFWIDLYCTHIRQLSGTGSYARQNRTSRNQFEKSFSSFMFPIDLSWNQLGPCRR